VFCLFAFASETAFLITLLNIGFMLFVIFIQRRNTAATWAWISAIALLPIGGFFLYMIFGQDSRKQRVFLKKSMEDEALQECYESMGNAIEGEITDDNRVMLFHDGVSKFDVLLADIENAKEFIFIQYYILRGDTTGKLLINKLTERARAGVEVYLLVDGMGCSFTSHKIYQPLIEAGGFLGRFMPPVPVRINFRNHRKIVVIDKHIAYLGGANIGDEYLGKKKRFGEWRDTHMRLTGGSVSPLTLRFIMDWNCESTEKLIKLPLNICYFSPKSINSTLGAKVRILSSGPDTRYPNILHGFCCLIMEAKTSVYIQSPYFVPDDALFTALRIAALSGVDVRVMYPANPDHLLVYWAASSYVGELMCAGVKGYEYTKGFLHAKTLMVDSKVCAVGTANMDVRSFKINFETHAFIENAPLTQELEEAFRRDMNYCNILSLEKYKKRSVITKIKESFSRLFSPLL